MLSALKIFEGYPGNASETDPPINVTTHRLIQATRFGYGQRFVPISYSPSRDPVFEAVLEQTLETLRLRQMFRPWRSELSVTWHQ